MADNSDSEKLLQLLDKLQEKLQAYKESLDADLTFEVTKDIQTSIRALEKEIAALKAKAAT